MSMYISDENECLAPHTYPCGSPRCSHCLNTIGSFQCFCKYGCVGDGYNCQPKGIDKTQPCHAKQPELKGVSKILQKPYI